MLKNIYVPLLLSLLSIFSFTLGWGFSEYDRSLKADMMDQYFEKLSINMDRVHDADMYSSEPFNSYNLSIILLESVSEDGSVEVFRDILVKELSSRKNAVAEYCKGRATEGFRSQCIKTIEKAEKLIEKYNS